jgi:hypothetical protein
MTDRYDLPRVNDRVQVVMANRAELAALVSTCEAGGFRYAADGSPVFMPGAQ